MIATKQKHKTKSAAETIINDETAVFYDSPLCVAQGDLYFVDITKLPKSAKPAKTRQLAEGNTQGSRHVCTVGDVFTADPEEIVKLIKAATKKTVGANYTGLVVRSVDNRLYIEHPEHGDHDFRCYTVRAVVVQRALDAEEREQRVQD